MDILIIYLLVVIASIAINYGFRLGKSNYRLDSNGVPRKRGATQQENLEVYSIAIISVIYSQSIYLYLDDKLNYIRTHYLNRYNTEKAKYLELILQDLVGKNVNTALCGDLLRQHLPYAERVQLISFLFDLAASDGKISIYEIKLLQEITAAIGVYKNEYINIFNQHMNKAGFNTSASQNTQQQQQQAPPPKPRQTTPRTSAFSILGLTPQASNDEVKRAYRKLAMQYHPDRVTTADEATQRRAAEQFRRITQAYQQIKSARGF